MRGEAKDMAGTTLTGATLRRITGMIMMSVRRKGLQRV